MENIFEILEVKYAYWQIYILFNPDKPLREIERLSGISFRTLVRLKGKNEALKSALMSAKKSAAKINNGNVLLADTSAEKSAKKSALMSAENNLPSIINKDIFDSFIQMRKAVKKPMTEKAKEILINKLILLDKKGYDVNKLLSLAIERCWLSVYENDACKKQEKEDRGTLQDEYMFKKYGVRINNGK